MEREAELIALAEEIMELRYRRGVDPSALLARFEAMVPYPNARHLFITDHEADYVVARALAFERVPDGPGRRDQLTQLVRQIRNALGGELADDIAYDKLCASVPHPRVPELLSDTALTDEEVVDAALTYQPIRL